MNIKLIFLLSLFGLAMAVATLSFIPAVIEPLIWLVIFVICAYLIAKNCTSKYFLNGFLVSILNSVWITGAHIIFASIYFSSHPQQAAVKGSIPLLNHPRLMMLITGPIIGVISGIILGLFAFIASKIVKKKVILLENIPGNV